MTKLQMLGKLRFTRTHGTGLAERDVIARFLLSDYATGYPKGINGCLGFQTR